MNSTGSHQVDGLPPERDDVLYGVREPTESTPRTVGDRAAERGIGAAAQVGTGHVVTVTASSATDEDGDPIVVGSNGCPGVRPPAAGLVSERCLHPARRPGLADGAGEVD